MNLRNSKNKWRLEREKLKSMTFRKKLSYIFDYYRWQIFLTVCAVVLVLFLCDVFYQGTKENVILGFATNDDWRLFDTDTVTSQFADYLGIDASKERIVFDASLYVDLDSSVDYVVGSQGQIAATTANQSLDFLITTPDLAEHYASLLPLKDLEDFLPEDMKEDLGDALTTFTNADGSAQVCAIDLSESRFMKRAWNNPVYEGLTPFYLIVTDFSPHPDAVLSFIRYAFNL